MPLSTLLLTRVFKALANRQRMEIIKLISKKPMTVLDISDNLKITFKTTSFHLLKLEREGLVKNEKIGKFVYYKPDEKFKTSGIFRQIINSR